MISFNVSGIRGKMVNWQITAATFRCDLVHEEVTLLVHKDWSVRCTGAQKYAAAKTKRNGSSPRCQGTDCQMAQSYRKKLQEEEAGS
jgi:hypothetical protein